MCGIVGLRLKDSAFEERLGELVAPMLDVLASRGPDSTGIAVYFGDVADSVHKYSLSASGKAVDWGAFAHRLGTELGCEVVPRPRGPDATVLTAAPPDSVIDAIDALVARGDGVRLLGFGRAVEVFKDVGPALDVCRRFGVPDMGGYQAIGHTRMATESAVTTEHSHPFVVASDLALVHNGTFSNYASIRRRLEAGGARFDTDNDSEVAARYVAAEMAGGLDLADALRGVLKVFDGFYTLLVATAEEFAVVRDSFACKPMVVAETDHYVAVGSEYVALARLPGIDEAAVFEPAPEEVYTWPR